MKKYNVSNYVRYKLDLEKSMPADKRTYDLYTRDELIIKFLPLVENMAHKFATTQQASGVLDITDLIQEGGIANMHYSISNTAEYGDYLSGPKVITDDTKEAMKKILENIQTGNFANEFLDDCRQSNDGSGGPFMKNNRQSTLNHPIEKVGKELRSKMKFLNSEKLVDKDKN